MSTTKALQHVKSKLTLENWIAQGAMAVRDRLRQELEPQIEGGTQTAAQLAHTYATLRFIMDQWDIVGDMLSAWRETMSKETIPAAFEAEKLKSFTTDSGYRVTVSDQLYVSIGKDVKPLAYAWLRKNKLGELIIETVNASTLSAAARYRLETDGKDLPEDLFNTTTVHNTSVTKTKTKTSKLGEVK